MNINLIHGLTGKEAGKEIELTLREFWDMYFRMLNLKWAYTMTDKDIQVMSWVLSNDITKCYFSTPHNNEIMDSMNNVSLSELSRVKKRLVDMGVLEDRKNPQDSRRRITLPVKQLVKIRQYIDKGGKITFIFPTNVNKE